MTHIDNAVSTYIAIGFKNLRLYFVAAAALFGSLSAAFFASELFVREWGLAQFPNDLLSINFSFGFCDNFYLISNCINIIK